MRRLIMTSALCAVTVALVSCATKTNPTQKAPGFLPDYAILQQVDSPSGTEIYTYKNPTVKRSDYHAAIIEPVSLYQTATESGVSSAQIEQARADINSGIQQIVSKKLDITTKPGAGVLKLQVAITGAVLEGEGFKITNLVPISAALKLASMATGMDNKKPIMVVELKILDSQDGKLLKEVVSTINGEKFRMASNTTEEFTKLANEWVAQALKYTNKP